MDNQKSNYQEFKMNELPSSHNSRSNSCVSFHGHENLVSGKDKLLLLKRRHTYGGSLLRELLNEWPQLCLHRETMTDKSSSLKHRPISKKLKTTPITVYRPHSSGPRPSTQGTTPKSQQKQTVVSTRQSIQMVQRTQSGAKQWRSSRTKKAAGERDPNKETPLEIFKRTAKAVRVISGICLIIKRYAQRGVQMEWETIQANLKLFAEFDCMMAFSLDNQDLSIRPIVSERMQRILDKKPCNRTVKEIQSVQWLLKENDAFQGYPLATQVELCKCMNYQRYEARRIILRQSHPPDGFYIIVSGTVMLNIYEKDKPIVKEVQAGGSFGEMELEKDIPRASTVVCKTDVELMVIFKEVIIRPHTLNVCHGQTMALLSILRSHSNTISLVLFNISRLKCSVNRNQVGSRHYLKNLLIKTDLLSIGAK